MREQGNGRFVPQLVGSIFPSIGGVRISFAAARFAECRHVLLLKQSSYPGILQSLDIKFVPTQFPSVPHER
jgi:hypothetical protein